MGQRHQIFVKIVNPVKAQYNTSSITAEMKKLCGTGDYAILPYHNQWLYGRSALQHALNVLIHASQFSKKDKETRWYIYRCWSDIPCVIRLGTTRSLLNEIHRKVTGTINLLRYRTAIDIPYI